MPLSLSLSPRARGEGTKILPCQYSCKKLRCAQFVDFGRRAGGGGREYRSLCLLSAGDKVSI
jgi:hypothetical protein